MTRRQSADAPPAAPPELDLPIELSEPTPAVVLPFPEPTPEEDEEPAPQLAHPVPPDIIPGIIPAGQVHLFSGAPGSGKTPLMAQFASAVFSESLLFGREDLRPRRPSFVGVIASDRIWKDQSAWYALVGHPDIPHYSLTDDFANVSGKKLRSTKRGDRFDLFCTVVERLCKGTPQFDSLIIVDPIALFLGGNLMDYDKVFSYMLDLNQYCLRHGVTLMGLGHVGKQRQDPAQRYTRPQDRIVGTTAQTGCAGTSFYIAPPSETNEAWHEFGWVPRHAPAAAMRLIPDPATGLFFSSAEIDISPGRVAKRDVAKLAAVLALIPPDAEIGVKELCETAELQLGLKKAMVYRHLARLEAEGAIEPGESRATRRRKLKLAN